ncbi:hypothetical protein H6P81_002704 [Aristolochia fimbriata]|uniref:Integrase catalytic domain-containing protein n=1 Tax=Aristolochia fimbriata TaxID=158543 RepID=A0AAV7FBN3_ARIFI|nr:hypothetical protein H6P81_002704 [Aristolochia fimbriata]
MVHTQFLKNIKKFRSDSRGEYVFQKFRALLNSHGTQHQLSCPYTPQQNGVVECKHRHIHETTRALLLSSSIPRVFWGEAILTSVYIINRLPSPVLHNNTPFASLYSVSPDYLSLRVFGSTCFVLLPERERDKLSARSAMCVFLGYGLQQKGFRYFDPVANKLRISRHVTFWEKIPFFSLPRNKSQSDISPISVFDLFPDLSVPLSSSVEQDVGSLPATPLPPEPSLGPAPVPDLDSSAPQLLVDPSSRYKARLVAKWYTQEYGIDYKETFAPVARLTSVRLLIALAAVRQWDLFQMDVKNAFLNGTIAEEVYVKPPPGYSHLPGQVCKFQRALYGLKQAPRAWFSMFCSKIVQFGYTQSSHDSALFTRCSSHGIVLLLLYVDDMVITGDDLSGIYDLKAYLSSCFEMKDLGPLRYFLGLEVLPLSGGYGISQVKYAFDLVNRASLSDSKTFDTPLELNVKVRPSDGELLADPTLYRQLVGGLLYLSITRPNISYTVHVVSQFMAAPRLVHYAAVIRILHYVKGMLLIGDPLLVTKFFWDTPPFRGVVRSSPLSLGLAQRLSIVLSLILHQRLSGFVGYFKIWGVHLDSSSPLYCDNKSAMQIAHNAVFHEKTKHIEVDCHFIRHHCALGTVDLLYVPSEDQVADLFTKSLTRSCLGYLCSKLQLCSFEPS